MGIVAELIKPNEDPNGDAPWVGPVVAILIAPFSDEESVGQVLKFWIALLGGSGLAAYLIFSGQTALGHPPKPGESHYLTAGHLFWLALGWSPSWLLFVFVVPVVCGLAYWWVPKKRMVRLESYEAWDDDAVRVVEKVQQVPYDVLPLRSQILLGCCFGVLSGLSLVPCGINAVMWGLWAIALKEQIFPGS